MMTMLRKAYGEYLESFMDCLEIFDHILHGRWATPDILIPEEVEQRAPEVKKGDITVDHLIAFMQSQGKPIGVFDAYIKTQKGGEQ